ncbi:MAG: 2-C-methyl-D-erythritol 4-phosphate cytidylyltransferase [Candidatus Marinimicrobia bacterium]|nr:2-C-methyl-D-erythritol 4-phosphate cytidylyltransferase [Candidatus Neomarinimicrobiota bacterium]|tara:strand:+ start:6573 stop:7244 length:672 start_codon:yes stop_codon:yes gene_type:complete
MEFVSAIIPAAGEGQRFGAQKQFKKLRGLPLVFYSIKQFYNCNRINEIVLVVPKEKIKSVQDNVSKSFSEKPILIIEGGLNRQTSVRNGIKASSEESNLVCIHDAARPFLTQAVINNSIDGCTNSDGAITAIPSNDTVKIAYNGNVKNTVERKNVWLAQTPQTFYKSKLNLAVKNGKRNKMIVTDESMLMEAMGYRVKLVVGDEDNFKITTKKDWARAEKLIY